MTMNNDFIQKICWLIHSRRRSNIMRRVLRRAAKAVAYLARNCLSSDATLQVGFADRTLGTHLPSNIIKAGKEIRSKLESVGIYRPNGREHFRGFVTVPLTNIVGKSLLGNFG